MAFGDNGAVRGLAAIQSKRRLVHSERIGTKPPVGSNVVAISGGAPKVSAETVSLLEQLLEERGLVP